MSGPRKTLRRFELPGTARYLTFSCYRRLPLFGNDLIKDRFVERLTRATAKPGLHVFAWVIMPEHVHLIVQLEGLTVESFLRSLKPSFAAEVLARWRTLRAPIVDRLDGFWQRGGGYDRNVVGDELLEKIRYCHKNPIERGLAETSVAWRWSSARRYESHADAVGPPIAFDRLPPSRGPAHLTRRPVRAMALTSGCHTLASGQCVSSEDREASK